MRSSYDSLLESDPDIQRIKAESKIEAKQDSAILVVEARFPNLAETAKQKVVRMNKIDEINTFTKMIARAPDKKTAQRVLDTFAA
jgi:hypothetical protein